MSIRGVALVIRWRAPLVPSDSLSVHREIARNRPNLSLHRALPVRNSRLRRAVARKLVMSVQIVPSDLSGWRVQISSASAKDIRYARVRM